ncbi:hypothetical protein SAMN05444359_12339 [Neolewinella agarilytica]|uniref:Uncharacterized protein n=1 Tax=Neolewinella agarilytica TaxID=478744 RepID=A0A1H9L7Z5_9BACT|nr:hypothetical protein SAMN05444359_12339 [Neolewinella agarilytica]
MWREMNQRTYTKTRNVLRLSDRKDSTPADIVKGVSENYLRIMKQSFRKGRKKGSFPTNWYEVFPA